MVPLVAILLLIVSATCEGNNWAEEQKSISTLLTSKNLEDNCQGITKNYCSRTGRNSFLLQSLTGVSHKEVWLEKIGNIIKALESIQTSTDIKQTYQSIIKDTFSALNDLLNDFYKNDNDIEELPTITKTLGEIEHRIQSTFTASITVEIKPVIDIIKVVIHLSENEFRDVGEKTKLSNMIVEFVNVIRVNAVTYVVYQPFLQKLDQLIRVVSNTVYSSTRLQALGVVLNEIFNEFNKVANRATLLIENSGTETEQREIHSVLSELTVVFQKVRINYQKKIQQEEFLAKQKEIKDNIVLTRNKFIQIITNAIRVMAQKPTQVNKLTDVLKELTKLKEDLRKWNDIVEFKEFLKLIENYFGFFQEIQSEWSNIYQSSNFDDTIKKVISALEDLNREILKVSDDYKTIIKTRTSFATHTEMIKGILAENKLLSEASKILTTIIKGFISLLDQRPSDVKQFNVLLDQLTNLKGDLKTAEGNKDVKEVLKLLENLTGFVQKIVSEWNNIYQSSIFEVTIKEVTSVLKDLNREIQISSNAVKTIIQINESFDKRTEIFQSLLAKINLQFETRNKIIDIINDFLIQISNRLPEKEQIIALIYKTTSVDIAVRQNPMNAAERENYLLLIEKLIVLLKDVLKMWDYLHSSTYEGTFYDEITRILKDTTQVSLADGSTKDYSRRIFVYVQKIDEIFQEEGKRIPNTGHSPLSGSLFIHILRDIQKLGEEENTNLDHFNTLIREILSFYEGTSDDKELKTQLQNIYIDFKALTPILKVNKDSKIEETFILRFRQLVKDNWLAFVDDKHMKETDLFLAQLKGLIDETEKKVFKDGVHVFHEILQEFRYLTKEYKPTLSHFQDTLKVVKLYEEESIKSEDLKQLTGSLYTLYKEFVSLLESKQQQPEAYTSIVSEYKKIVHDTLDPVALKEKLEQIAKNFNLFTRNLKDFIDGAKYKF